MEVIRRNEIDRAFEKEQRQYLTGHLEKPQILQHIDDDIEIGISQYREFTANIPHMHPIATEHNYILEGCIRIRLCDGSDAELEFKAGDFFVLRPGTPYASKNAAGTKILFVKTPGINDKTVIQVDEKTKKWLSAWE